MHPHNYAVLYSQVYRTAKSRMHEYAWITFAWYPQEVWNEPFVQGRAYNAYNDCTPDELKEMFNRVILITAYPHFDINDADPIIGNIVSCTNVTKIFCLHLYYMSV